MFNKLTFLLSINRKVDMLSSLAGYKDKKFKNINFKIEMHKTPHSFALQQAYNRIKTDIIKGTWKPGKLISAISLNEELQIEPLFIQEVLCHLMYAGLITSNNDSTFSIININESMIRDICATLLQIEEIAIPQSIANGDDKWEAEIHKTLQELDNAINQQPDSFSLLIERNENFHHAIVANCNSPILLQTRSHLYQKYNVIMQLYAKTVPPKSLLIQKQEEHRMIAQAALSRDAKKTCNLNYYHIINSVKIIVDALKKNE